MLLAQALQKLAFREQHFGVLQRLLRVVKSFKRQLRFDDVASDFGIAQLSEDAGATKAGAIVGTPAYMAPEAVLGKAIDARTDVYGLAATLYDALTGGPPVEADSIAQTLLAVAHEVPVPIAARRGQPVSEELERLMAACLAKDFQKASPS